MFQLNSTLTLTIIGLVFASLVGFYIYYQSSTIDNYELKLQNSATTAKVVQEAHKTASFEQKQEITFQKEKETKKEVSNEKSISNLSDGNYTINFK